VTPPASAKRTKTRLFAGSKAIELVAVTKIANVGVALAPMSVLRLPLTGVAQLPVAGTVRQMPIATGRFASPVSAPTPIAPAAPAFVVATAKAPVSPVPPMLRMPSREGVVATATMSGVAATEALSSNVFTPVMVGAGGAFAQRKSSATLVLGMGAEGVTE